MTKQELRKWIRAEKKSYGKDELKSMSDRVAGSLELHPDFIQAQTVLLYNSLPDEVSTQSLLEKYSGVKNILLPRVVGDDLELISYHPDAVHVGAFGIMEPDGAPFTDYPSIDLAVIPGMAFDAQGHRLGRGRGYYDRLLPKLQCKKIGLCFPFQFLELIPTEPHDIPMDEVIQ